MDNPFQAYQRFLNTREESNCLRQTSTSKANSKATCLDFTNNDCLNLSHHPEVTQQAIEYTKKYGTSASASRLLYRSQELFHEIEQKLAQLKGTDTSLLFSSGFAANSSVIAALLNPLVLKNSPLVFTDKLVHASIHEGIKQAGAKQIRFHHQDLEHLERRLEDYAGSVQPRFIIVESLYGMQGTITDLKGISEISKRHKAFLYVDEAHAFGAYGKYGGGFSAHLPDVDLHMGNFGKALGGFGGYIACSKELRTYLINTCQGFIYSTALPPSVLGAQAAALSLLSTLDEQRSHLQLISRYLHHLLQKNNIHCTFSKSHIVGLLFKSVLDAKKCYQSLYEDDIYLSFIRPPTVPQSLLRICLNSSHQYSDIDRLVQHLTLYLNSNDGTGTNA